MTEPANATPSTATVPRSHILAWGAWEWGSASFNAVATTFVFSVYLSRSGTNAHGNAETWLGWGLAAAGFVIAVLAPITGQRSDRSGRRKPGLAANTGVVILCLVAMVFVRPLPDYLWLGVFLIALGNVCFEFAFVPYNALLASVSTPRTIGRVSGFGWGLGYVGGIVLLLILYIGFIAPDTGWFGVTAADGWNVRVAMVCAGVWFLLATIPVLVVVPEPKSTAAAGAPRISLMASYVALVRDIRALWHSDRVVLRFLIASAVFRDGLAGIFTFGAILASSVFGIPASDVLVFGIAANVVAGITTISVGWLDDRLGPRLVMVVSLTALCVLGGILFVWHTGGPSVYWVFGLALSAFVGPIQSASRTFLSRMAPPDRQGEYFGLYATTGRAASFLAPAAFALFVQFGHGTYFGILGIMLVLVCGLALLLWARLPRRTAAARL